MPEDNKEAYYEAARALNDRAFQAKERMRKRLTALSFDEKIKILEKLRDRSLAIAARGLRREDPAGTKKAGDHKI